MSNNVVFAIVFESVHSELDNYQTGCNPDTSSSRFLVEPIVFEASTLKELLKEVKKLFNVSQKSLLLNSCGECGRLDVQTYSLTVDGLRCSYNRVKSDFEAGKRALWLNNISGHVTKTTKPDLVKELEKENKAL